VIESNSVAIGYIPTSSSFSLISELPILLRYHGVRSATVSLASLRQWTVSVEAARRVSFSSVPGVVGMDVLWL
jgi:hypothetical protein